MPPAKDEPIIPQPLIAKHPHLYSYDPTYALHENVEAEFFVYQFPTLGPFTAAAVLQAQVIIQANTAFELREIVYSWNLDQAGFTEATRPIPLVTLQLQDSGSGKNLFSAPVPLDSVAVLGQNRRRASMWPRIFSPNSAISAIVTNYDGTAVTGSLRLTLTGRHLYKLAGR
jgi:hypothetical protein